MKNNDLDSGMWKSLLTRVNNIDSSNAMFFCHLIFGKPGIDIVQS